MNRLRSLLLAALLLATAIPCFSAEAIYAKKDLRWLNPAAPSPTLTIAQNNNLASRWVTQININSPFAAGTATAAACTTSWLDISDAAIPPGLAAAFARSVNSATLAPGGPVTTFSDTLGMFGRLVVWSDTISTVSACSLVVQLAPPMGGPETDAITNTPGYLAIWAGAVGVYGGDGNIINFPVSFNTAAKYLGGPFVEGLTRVRFILKATITGNMRKSRAAFMYWAQPAANAPAAKR